MVTVHATIGMGSDQLLPALLQRQPDADLATRLKGRHDDLFRAYWDRLQPTAGATEFVRACAQRDLRVVLASSAADEELAALRRALNADDAITAATSAQDVSTSKPAPDLVQRALQLVGVANSDTVFVGDTVWDVRAAQQAGVDCVALTCGGSCADALLRAGAVAVYESPAALLLDLRSSPLSRLV